MGQQKFHPGDWIVSNNARSPTSGIKLVVGVGSDTITYANESGSTNTVRVDYGVELDPYCRGYKDYWRRSYQFSRDVSGEYRWQRINICRSTLVIAQFHYPEWSSFSIEELRGARMCLYLHCSEDETQWLDMPSIELRISDCLLPARDGEPLIVVGDLLGEPPGEVEYISRDATAQ